MRSGFRARRDEEGSKEKVGSLPVVVERQSFSGAEKEALAAIEADPTNPRHHWNLMLVFEMRKEWRRALEQVDLYIDKGDPDHDGQAKRDRLLAKLEQTKKGVFSTMFRKK